MMEKKIKQLCLVCNQEKNGKLSAWFFFFFFSNGQGNKYAYFLSKIFPQSGNIPEKFVKAESLAKEK